MTFWKKKSINRLTKKYPSDNQFGREKIYKANKKINQEFWHWHWNWLKGRPHGSNKTVFLLLSLCIEQHFVLIKKISCFNNEKGRNCVRTYPILFYVYFCTYSAAFGWEAAKKFNFNGFVSGDMEFSIFFHIVIKNIKKLPYYW